jgi:hypothetical protein
MLDDYDVYSRQRPTMSAQNRRSLEWWKMSASPLGGSIASGRQHRLWEAARGDPTRRLCDDPGDLRGTRGEKVRDRDTRVNIALSGGQVTRLWRLLGEQLTDQEKAADS